MKKALLVLLILLLLVMTVPLVVPVPPLEGTVPPRELADPDSQFIELNGVDVHVKTSGAGEPAFVLLHGFGASLYSWNAVMTSIAENGRVIAYDRTGFGLTERPLNWVGENPYSSEAQLQLLWALLDHFAMDKAILVGNSAGGTLGLQFSLAYPERVQGLVLVDPAVYSGGGAPTWLRPLLNTPQAKRLGPLFVRQFLAKGSSLLDSAWYDPTLISQETRDLYTKPLRAENWDRALWEFTLASQPTRLPERLGEIALPVLVITGDNDRIVPAEQSVRLAGELPQAELVVIPQAGHVPHEEKPDLFLNALEKFVYTINK